MLCPLYVHSTVSSILRLLYSNNVSRAFVIVNPNVKPTELNRAEERINYVTVNAIKASQG